MDVPSTYKKNKNADKWRENESEGSFKRDIFVVVIGLVLILLGFVLFGTVTGLQLHKGFPINGKVVVDDRGEIVDVGYSKISPELAQGYIQTGIILGIVAIIVFISVLIIIRWVKKEDFFKRAPLDRGSRDSWKE